MTENKHQIENVNALVAHYADALGLGLVWLCGPTCELHDHSGKNANSRGKRPIEEAWNAAPYQTAAEFLAARPDSAVNVGIRTGYVEGARRCVIALDLDTAANVAWADSVPELASRVVRKRGEGSQIRVFKYDGDNKNEEFKLPGDEVKKINALVGGRQFVAPGNTHHTGQTYEAVEPWTAQLLDAAPRFPREAFLVAAAKAKRVPPAAREDDAAPADEDEDRAKILNEWNNRPYKRGSRALRYLKTCPASIEGEGGSAALMVVARHVAWGFAVGWHEEDGFVNFDKNIPAALIANSDWNQKECKPPWSLAEVKHACHNAAKPTVAGELVRMPWGVHLTEREQPKPQEADPGNDSSGDDVDLQLKPQVQDTPPQVNVINEVLAALAAVKDVRRLFVKGGEIVSVIDGKIAKHTEATLQTLITDVVDLYVIKMPTAAEREAGDEPKRIAVHPKPWLARGIMQHLIKPGLARLDGVVSAPILRPDGSVLSTAGYDEQTRLFYHSKEEYPPLPALSVDSARAARERLEDLFAEMPWASDKIGKAVALSGILSLIARATLDRVPAHAASGNAIGTGKTKVPEIATMIALGQKETSSWAAEDVELRKLITSKVDTGARYILFDDVPSYQAFTGGTINRLLTSTTWSDRLLGSSTLCSSDGQVHGLVIFVTGVNLNIKSDVIRRTICAFMISEHEAPWLRVGFKYPDLDAYVAANRKQYLVDGLTILAAYFAAGKPKQEVVRLGSFEQWSDLVASAIVWAGGADPAKSQEDLRENDESSLDLAQLIAGWQELCKDKGKDCLSAREAFNIMQLNMLDSLGSKNPQKYRGIWDLFAGSKLTGRSLGTKLGHFKNRVLGGLRLVALEADRDKSTKTDRWRVESVKVAQRRLSAA